MNTTTADKKTSLFQKHVDLGARMVSFGGWSMPVQYKGILSEYDHTRQAVSIFDISHMGEFVVEGNAVESGLDRIVTQNVKDLNVGSCRYGAMLNENGGVIDDLIVFRTEDAKWMIVVNGATIEKDAQHFQKHITPQGKFCNISNQIAKVDVQGPLSREVLTPLVKDIGQLKYYSFAEFNVLGEDAIVSRTGYTGELGYEIYYPWEKVENLWNEVCRNDKIKPAGLGARDLLRLEMGYSLYGNELDENISPLEAGLERFVDLSKDFIGKEPLLRIKEKGSSRKLAAFVSASRRSPRHGHKILSTENEEIGVVTSGAFSPYLQKGIGMGFLKPEFTSEGLEIIIGCEKNNIGAQITGRPFYRGGSLKN